MRPYHNRKKKKRKLIVTLIVLSSILVVTSAGILLITQFNKWILQEDKAAAAIIDTEIDQDIVMDKPESQTTTNANQPIAANKTPLVVHSLGAEMIDFARLDKDIKEIQRITLAAQLKKEPIQQEQVTIPDETVKSQTEIQPNMGNNQHNVATYMPFIEQAAQEFNIEPSWILAVIDQESNFNEKADNVNTNGTIDKGLMQINSSTSPWIAQQLQIPYQEDIEFDPAINIRMGAFYLSYIRSKNANTHFMFTSYNRGIGGAETWLSKTGTYETSYSRSVVEKIKKYDMF